MPSLTSLSTNEEVQVGALTAAVVYGIFQVDLPNLASVHNAPQGNMHVHNSVKTAAWTSVVVTSGIALLAKSPTVFVIGGLMTVIEAWKYHHANVLDPNTRKVDHSPFL